ncbi:MAG: hypothetical protein ACPGQL_00855 [Thermoplasmatota archaeon]
MLRTCLVACLLSTVAMPGEAGAYPGCSGQDAPILVLGPSTGLGPQCLIDLCERETGLGVGLAMDPFDQETWVYVSKSCGGSGIVPSCPKGIAAEVQCISMLDLAIVG